MLVQIGETKYVVSWQHSLPGIIKIGGKKIKVKGSTSCTVSILNKDDFISTGRRYGSVYCSHQDQYNKNVGRKLSLKKAVCKLNKYVRREFWKAYAEMRGGKF